MSEDEEEKEKRIREESGRRLAELYQATPGSPIAGAKTIALGLRPERARDVQYVSTLLAVCMGAVMNHGGTVDDMRAFARTGDWPLRFVPCPGIVYRTFAFAKSELMLMMGPERPVTPLLEFLCTMMSDVIAGAESVLPGGGAPD